ncbi:MAG: Cytochrome c-type biogenesis protein CcdA (DsbD analog), partial [uncultured Nocardioidaceae bacterium]
DRAPQRRRMVLRDGVLGVLAARRPGGGGRRTGLVLLPLRGAAAARLPVVCDRAVRSRPGVGAARPPGRRQLTFRARVLAGLRRARDRVRCAGRVAGDLHARDQCGPRGGDDPRGSRLPRVHPVPAARRPGARRTFGGARCGSDARRPVRARLDPLHRTHPVRRPGPRGHRGNRRAGRAAQLRLLPGTWRPVHPRRAGVPAHARRCGMGTSPPGVGHAGRRSDADRGGHPAGHRHLAGLGAVPARVDRLRGAERL